MEAALRAIAEPRRREILRLVWDAEITAGEIASHFDVSRPAISQHLKVLREAGLVTERRQGTMRLYRARPEGLSEVRAFLEGFWDHRLEGLKRAAEREERMATWKRLRLPPGRAAMTAEAPSLHADGAAGPKGEVAMAQEEAERSDAERTVVREVRIDARPETVFSFFIDPTR
jgi:DNA-binding transcriptional ArsR family regulator